MDLPKIEKGFRLVLEGLGLESGDPNLRDTPRRTAEAWATELLVGLSQSPPELELMPLEEGHRTGLIALDQVPVKSVCAHHLLPFVGQATVAYLPKGAICGLSKLSRVVDHFSRQPQLQEHLTQQIAVYLQQRLDPVGVGVVIRASHMCMEFRGVNHAGVMTTSCLLGELETDPALRAQFLGLGQTGPRSASS